ncbi:hypothetical protein DL770_011267 [Monosporascus sp. CRB-9-2]|nr:hypothetical protein DL770_011267 [Monosporascus sp. CRB-9-2]
MVSVSWEARCSARRCSGVSPSWEPGAPAGTPAGADAPPTMPFGTGPDGGVFGAAGAAGAGCSVCARVN